MAAPAHHREKKRKTPPQLTGVGDHEPAPFPVTLRVLVLSLLLLLSAYTVFAGLRVRRAADAALGNQKPVISLVVQADGRVLNPETAGGEPEANGTVEQVFGVPLHQLLEDQKHGHGALVTMRGQTGQQSLSITHLAPSGLLVITATPVVQHTAAEQRSLIEDTIALLAPLAIGLCLAIVVFRQTNKAEMAQIQRRETERRFRSAVEAAHCGIWEWRIREDMVDRVRQALVDAAEHGAFDVTFRVPGASGDAWIDARGQGIGERDELGYAAIMGVALDVTEEHVAQARGLAAEARLNDAIEAVSEAFVLWDRHDRLVMCNRNYREFFSLDPRLLKPGASRQTIMHVAEIAVRGERPAPDARAGIREAEMIDGRWLQISERTTADGGTVMTAADITAVKRQEEASRRNEIALKRAVVRLEQNGGQLAELAAKYEQEKIRAQQANAAKSEFLANMSHELRTPLNAINGFSEMMAREMLGPLGHQRYVEYANDIHASGHHLLALINDILDMAKIEAGKQSLNLEDVNLASLIEDALRLMGPRATEGSLTLSSDIPPLPPMEVDHRAIKQVVLNLLSTAIKFTPRGGRVKIVARQVDYRVMVSVMDTGIGISKEDLARLAQPFQQVESQLAKTQQGTGLGLALSKSLIELHEGRFEIASEPGRGTTVSFILPIRQRQTRDRSGARLDIEPGDYTATRSHG